MPSKLLTYSEQRVICRKRRRRQRRGLVGGAVRRHVRGALPAAVPAAAARRALRRPLRGARARLPAQVLAAAASPLHDQTHRFLLLLVHHTESGNVRLFSLLDYWLTECIVLEILSGGIFHRWTFLQNLCIAIIDECLIDFSCLLTLVWIYNIWINVRIIYSQLNWSLFFQVILRGQLSCYILEFILKIMYIILKYCMFLNPNLDINEVECPCESFLVTSEYIWLCYCVS